MGETTVTGVCDGLGSSVNKGTDSTWIHRLMSGRDTAGNEEVPCDLR